MTMLVPPQSVTTDDTAAIADLRRLYALQRAAFLADPYPPSRSASGTSRPWPR